MSYPIFKNQIPVGTLSLSPDGLYTRFTARLPYFPGLWRLWLMGEGSAPLGLMEPGEDCLLLSRRLSRSEMKKLPPFTSALLLPAGESPPETAPAEPETAPAEPETAPAEPENPPEPEEKDAASCWQRLSDGCLYRCEGERRFLAIPCHETLRHPKLRFLLCGGKKYIVFRY